MKLSVKALINVDNLNAYKTVAQTEANEGQPNYLHFKLIDMNRDGIRYIPTSGSSLKVIFDSIDDSKVIEVIASNPFPDDRSIFKVALTSSQIPASGGIKFVLTEDGIQKSFYVSQLIIVNTLDVGGC